MFSELGTLYKIKSTMGATCARRLGITVNLFGICEEDPNELLFGNDFKKSVGKSLDIL